MSYTDKNGIIIKAGDILAYIVPDNSSLTAYESIDVVVELNGELWGVEKVGVSPNWELRVDWTPCELMYYAEDINNPHIKELEIIGNITDNPEMLTIAYAELLFNKE